MLFFYCNFLLCKHKHDLCIMDSNLEVIYVIKNCLSHFNYFKGSLLIVLIKSETFTDSYIFLCFANNDLIRNCNPEYTTV